MNTGKYPATKAQANELLRQLRTGCIDMPLHLIRYCLLMTGDLT